MAESAVTFLLNQLAILIREERQLLGGLQGEVQQIERQLSQMQAFLRVADAKEDSDPELKVWVSQVRELAYDAEDVLDMFMLRFGHLSAEGFLGCFKKVYATMKNCSARRYVASQLREIVSRVNEMKDEYPRFQRKYEASMQASSSHVVNRKFDGRDDARLVDAKVLVGIEGPKEELLNQILDVDSQLKAISVVGMGGLGKSTLVNSIYKDQRVKEKFQCHSWVTVSKVYNIEELLKKLIRQISVEVNEPLQKNVESIGDIVELKQFVQDFLGQKSYIIVLDDIWNVNSWDDIRHAFPNSDTGSRLLLTTRICDVANATRVEYSGYVYEMKGLPFRESWTLFCNKTFQDKICPQHLEHIAKHILAKCDGLPLAILAVGGMLASKNNDAISEWEMVYKSLNSELDGELEKVKLVVLLSYYDLPFYLKLCLLYCSIFPKHLRIGREVIIQLWAAERLVQGSENKTKEEVAAGYLNKLIHRNLVQETKAGTCYLHDIVHEVIVSKSREQNILSTGSEKDSVLPTKVRRLSFHSSIDDTPKTNSLEHYDTEREVIISKLREQNRLSTGSERDSVLPTKVQFCLVPCCPLAFHSSTDDTPKTNSLKHLRSIVLFFPKDSESKQVINDLVAGNHKLLKVLYLQAAPLKEIPNEVFKLCLLTYLNLSFTEVKFIPKSIGKLLHLEALHLGGTNVTELPIQILKLKRLRHLLVFKDIGREDHLLDTVATQSFKAPYRIGCLSSLQSLKCIDADQMGDTSMVKEIGRLTQLKKLGICNLKREDGKDLCSSLEKLSYLHYLTVISIDFDEIIDLDYSLSSIPQLLQELCLEGRLEKVPRWIPFLMELKSLELVSSKLSDDTLKFLEDLPNLEELHLTDAFEGTTLHFKAGKFPSLKRLGIWHMRGLKSIVVEGDSMPKLTELTIRYCKLMIELPDGLENLTKLQEFKVKCMNEKFVAALENGKRSDEKLAHISMAVYGDDERGWRYL